MSRDVSAKPRNELTGGGVVIGQGPIRRNGRPRGRRSQRGRVLTVVLLALATAGGLTQPVTPRAGAAAAPEVEYVYDVAVRRHYNFPNDDAVGYGHGICDRVTRGEGYPQVIGKAKSDVAPNDEASANYLVSYAVNLLCPEQIWQLRHTAANYQSPTQQHGGPGSRGVTERITVVAYRHRAIGVIRHRSTSPTLKNN